MHSQRLMDMLRAVHTPLGGFAMRRLYLGQAQTLRELVELYHQDTGQVIPTQTMRNQVNRLLKFGLIEKNGKAAGRGFRADVYATTPEGAAVGEGLDVMFTRLEALTERQS